MNVESPEWKEVVKELQRERENLREELEGFNDDPSKRDRSDFLRGRLFELNQLINRKNKD